MFAGIKNISTFGENIFHIGSLLFKNNIFEHMTGYIPYWYY